MEREGIMKRIARSGRAGMAMVLLGGCALGTGLVQTTSATRNEPPNKQCPTGTEFVARWDWSQDKGKYAWRLHSGDSSAAPTNKSNRNSGPWSSTNTGIAALVIVSEPFSKIATYNPPVKSGAFDNNGLTKANGTKPGKWDKTDLERLVFCSAIPPATTTTAPTTAAPTTAAPTTAAPTTATPTTAAPTTATPTTAAPTTAAPTTEPPADGSTTTTEPTTTTEAPTTTAEPTTTTEAPVDGETTTTTAVGGATTTTDPGDIGGSTTTTAPGATTTTAAGAVLGTTSIYNNDDPAVAGAVQARPLAATGSTSAPLVVAGIVLILGGGAILTINRLREQQARA